MTTSEIKANAREALKGKWGKAALITLVYGIISYIISLVLGFIPVVGSLISLVITLPISYGIIAVFMKFKRGEEVGYVDFFTLGFEAFSKVWGVFGNILLKMIVPIILVVVAAIIFAFGLGASASSSMIDAYTTGTISSASVGFSGLAIVGILLYFAAIIYAVIKGLYYTLAYNVLFDNPNMTGKEIVEESERLMQGNRWSYVWLGITFIGWSILATLTLGIGYFWLMPYMMVSTICFYENLAGKSTSTTTVESEPVQTEE